MSKSYSVLWSTLGKNGVSFCIRSNVNGSSGTTADPQEFPDLLAPGKPLLRSTEQLDRAKEAIKGTGIPFKLLDQYVEITNGNTSIGTMHLAKGLEFRSVVVMACDDEIIALQERIESVGDDADLQEIYDTERHLLYVACTRGRDHLLVTGVDPASEFLDDLRA